MKYARVLLAHCPEQTTELFKAYYTGQYQPHTKVEPPAEPQAQPTSTVQSLAGLLPLRYVTGGSATPTQAPTTDHAASEEPPADAPPKYEIPKPRTAFSAFVDHPQEFIDFLETLVRQPDLSKEAQIDLFTTLFEMYLDAAKGKKDAAGKKEWEEKAKKLIEGKDVSTLHHGPVPLLTIEDSNLNFKRPPSLRPVQFPRRFHARP